MALKSDDVMMMMIMMHDQLHFASERPVVSYFSRILERQEIVAESEFPIIAATAERDPIQAR